MLLRGLENELDGTLEVRAILLELPCCSWQCGGVKIVSAGMYNALRYRGIWKRSFLAHGQRVDIRAERDRLSRLIPAYDRDKPG